MVFFNYSTMQMAAKIVYYGPGLCGKTTNLHQIYAKTSPQSRGEMVSLETETDRTLFFDLLPIDVGVIGGFKTRLQLYTVPGQVFYNTTRKLVLKGVDGIVFVADSQRPMLDANAESFRNLRENLAEIGLNVDELPVVIQLNKRDLPNAADPDAILDVLDAERRLDYVEAIATTGVGVFETLKVISKLTLRTLRRRMTGEEPPRPAASSRTAQFRVRDTGAMQTIAGNAAVPAPEPPVAAEPPAAPEPEPPPEPAQAAPEPEPEPAPVATEQQSPRGETEQEAAPTPADAPPMDLDATIAAAAQSRDIDTSAVAAEPLEAPFGEPPPADAIFGDTPSTEYLPPSQGAPAAAASEEPSETSEPAKERDPEVKTVKVRSSVDVMAELEALRKRATQVSPKSAPRDILADLRNLRPKRDIHRTLHLQIPADVLPRTRSVRVTLAFEDGNGVIETREQELELGEISDVQSLSVNLKIDQA